ncbi:MAG: hypothetical protein C7B46_19515 [Sulfobacillus benefaciens]|uniref:Helix-turn-helix domain-containing protein n=1 Tax=Sulfobacillus benefaciens TaxID=453960 RepID=A0A2T2WYL5_9FIRM|nr:MAG: hypothetical protein C7B46_19515 [Sulfobacillus benefaciens]
MLPDINMPNLLFTQTSPRDLRLNSAEWTNFLTRPDLTNSARQLWTFLRNSQRKMPYVYYSVPTIARHLGLSVRTVQRACRDLEMAGLLIIKSRQDPRHHDPTSNLYFPRFVWYSASPQSPSVSPPLPSACHHPERLDTPEIRPTQDVADSARGAIKIQGQAVRKIELPSPPRLLAMGIENPEAVVSLFRLGNFVPPSRLDRWLSQYGEGRVALVISWALSAPRGTIESVGAWVQKGLAEQWTEKNAWVIAAEKALRAEEREKEQHRRTEQDVCERQRIAQDRQAFEEKWARLHPHLESAVGRQLWDRVKERLRTEDRWDGVMLERFATDKNPRVQRLLVEEFERSIRDVPKTAAS